MEWHRIEDERPEKDELVLCVGKNGGYFLGYWRRRDEFYVPNYRGGFRPAVAWYRFERYERSE